MKKILTALITTSLIATPLISAQANARSVHTERTVRYDGHGHRTVVKTERARQGGHTVKRSVVRKSQPAYASHKWAKGQRFDRRHASNYRVIDSPRAYHLRPAPRGHQRSEEHTSELQSLMRTSYADFFLQKTQTKNMII